MSSSNNQGPLAAAAAAAAAPAQPPPQEPQQRSVADHVRERQRAVAEREASRLARPLARPRRTLAHANRMLSGVTSTPSGVMPLKKQNAAAAAAQSTEWCGPLAIARQMIAAREQARREQEEEEEQAEGNGLVMHHPLDQAMEELEQERKRKEHPSLKWKPAHTNNNENGKNGNKTKASSTSSWYAKRQRTSAQAQAQVPTLLSLCLEFLVEHFEQVESLGEIGPEIRKQIAAALVGRHKLDGNALQALVHLEGGGGGLESLELLDASGITADELTGTLEQLLPRGLRYLCLDQCGRCFGSKAVQVLLRNGGGGGGTGVTSSPTTTLAHPPTATPTPTSSQLVALSIGGAYLLKDAEAAEILRNLPQLSSVDFKACPLLGVQTCQALATAKARSAPLVELALEDLRFDESCWQALTLPTTTLPTGSKSAFCKLERLKLCRMTGLTDDIVTQLLSLTVDDDGDGTNGEDGTPTCSLQALDLSHNYDLTDTILEAIRQYTSTSLRNLNLSGLGQLSSAGLEALFTVVEDTSSLTPPPPLLAVLELANLDCETVTDSVLKAVLLTAANVATTAGGGDTETTNVPQLSVGGGGRGGMVHLNVQGAKLLTDASLEHLVQYSKSSLQELNVSYCTGLTDQGLGYLIDHCGIQLNHVELWGLAQLTDTFLEGHCRTNDPTLVLTGIWMKGVASRAIQ